VPTDASNQRFDGHIQMSGSWSARQFAGEVVKVSCGSNLALSSRFRNGCYRRDPVTRPSQLELALLPLKRPRPVGSEAAELGGEQHPGNGAQIKKARMENL